MAAPALQAAGAALGGRVAAARARSRPRRSRCSALLLLIVAPLALLVVERRRRARAASPDGIPAAFVPIYRESAARVRPQLAPARRPCTSEETGFSTHPTTYHGRQLRRLLRRPVPVQRHQRPAVDLGRPQVRLPPRPPARPRYPHPQAPHPSVYDDFDAGMAAGVAAARQRRRRDTLDARTFQALCAPTTAPARSPRPTPAASSTAPATGSASAAHRAGAAAPALGRAAARCRGRSADRSPRRSAMRWGRLHAGIDIAVPTGTPILAAATGRVTTRGWVAGYGLLTCLEHTAAVLDLLRAPVAPRARRRPAASSRRGALVGLVGCTGHCFGPHLHFEVRISGRPVDPLPYLAEAAEMARRGLIARARCLRSRSSRAARTPTARTHDRRDDRAARAPARRPAARRRASAARAATRDTAPAVAADAQRTRTSRRRRLLLAVGQLELAHDRPPAATARPPRDRPARRASSPPKRGSRAHDQALRARPPRRRAAASSRSTSSPAPRRGDAVCVTHEQEQLTDGRADLGGAPPPRLPRHARSAPRDGWAVSAMGAAALAARLPLPRRARRDARRRRAGSRSTSSAARSSPSADSSAAPAPRRSRFCLARQAARESARPVLLTEPDASAAASPSSPGTPAPLALCRARPARRRRASARASRSSSSSRGLRLVASAPRRGADAAARRTLGALLGEARAAHGLVVVDCGTSWAAAQTALLDAATHIVWTSARHASRRSRRARAAARQRRPRRAARPRARALVARRHAAGARARACARCAGSPRQRCDRLVLIPHSDAARARRARPTPTRLEPHAHRRSHTILRRRAMTGARSAARRASPRRRPPARDLRAVRR